MEKRAIKNFHITSILSAKRSHATKCQWNIIGTCQENPVLRYDSSSVFFVYILEICDKNHRLAMYQMTVTMFSICTLPKKGFSSLRIIQIKKMRETFFVESISLMTPFSCSVSVLTRRHNSFLFLSPSSHFNAMSRF